MSQLPQKLDEYLDDHLNDKIGPGTTLDLDAPYALPPLKTRAASTPYFSKSSFLTRHLKVEWENSQAILIIRLDAECSFEGFQKEARVQVTYWDPAQSESPLMNLSVKKTGMTAHDLAFVESIEDESSQETVALGLLFKSVNDGGAATFSMDPIQRNSGRLTRFSGGIEKLKPVQNSIKWMFELNCEASSSFQPFPKSLVTLSGRHSKAVTHLESHPVQGTLEIRGQSISLKSARLSFFENRGTLRPTSQIRIHGSQWKTSTGINVPLAFEYFSSKAWLGTFLSLFQSPRFASVYLGQHLQTLDAHSIKADELRELPFRDSKSYNSAWFSFRSKLSFQKSNYHAHEARFEIELKNERLLGEFSWNPKAMMPIQVWDTDQSPAEVRFCPNVKGKFHHYLNHKLSQTFISQDGLTLEMMKKTKELPQ